MGARIVVEARKTPALRDMLDAMADACVANGHEVRRWRGPLSGRMPYPRWMPPCDAAILFNGAHRTYRPALARLHACGAATLFVELGWYPQAGTFQVDPLGVNAAASWCRNPLETEGTTSQPLRPEGDLLVLLQLDDDTQITERSPWFANMAEFLQHVCLHSALPVRVRPHPLSPLKQLHMGLTAELSATWDDAPTLAASLDRAKAVACINSSAAVEAMAKGLPVLCYGEAIYRHPGAVFTLTDDADQTREVTEELAGGKCRLHRESIAETVERITQRQWRIAEVPHRLPKMLDEALAARPGVHRRRTSADRVEQAWCWFADLPSRWLYHNRAWRAKAS